MAEKFEKQMKRLEEIVQLLENEQLDLDESIKLYEEGLQLNNTLQNQLKVFEEKIDRLNKENNHE